MAADRLTITEVARTLLERGHSDRRPSITLERSAAPGSKGLVKIAVEVPVCDEFPTADDAYLAAMTYFDALNARYPMPDVNGGEPDKPAVSDSAKVARKAAAIAKATT